MEFLNFSLFKVLINTKNLTRNYSVNSELASISDFICANFNKSLDQYSVLKKYKLLRKILLIKKGIIFQLIHQNYFLKGVFEHKIFHVNKQIYL